MDNIVWQIKGFTLKEHKTFSVTTKQSHVLLSNIFSGVDFGILSWLNNENKDGRLWCLIRLNFHQIARWVRPVHSYLYLGKCTVCLVILLPFFNFPKGVKMLKEESTLQHSNCCYSSEFMSSSTPNAMFWSPSWQNFLSDFTGSFRWNSSYHKKKQQHTNQKSDI